MFTLVPLALLPARGVGGWGASGWGGGGGRGATSSVGLRPAARDAARPAGGPATLTFLAAYLLYNDGVQTAISQALSRSLFSQRFLSFLWRW